MYTDACIGGNFKNTYHSVRLNKIINSKHIKYITYIAVEP